MNWMVRIFASALARRLAVVIVAGLLAFLGIGSARAQTPLYPDQGSAVAACYASMQAQKKHDQGAGIRTGSCVTVSPYTATISSYFCRTVASGGSPCIGGGIFYFGKADTCDKRPAQSTLFLPPGGSTRCNGGCEAKYTWMGADSTGKETTMANYTGATCNPDNGKDECNAKNGSGSTPPAWVWNGYLGVCQPINTECPAGQSAKPDGKCASNDECPITHVLNSSGVCVKKDQDCAAGTIRGPDGMCKQDDETDKSKCGTGMAKGKDGTCKIDANNDGIPDSDQDPDDPKNNKDGKQFSGGDNCNVPPSCSGDPIMCGQARIQWRIECNTRKAANIAGGACSSMPVCTGEGCKPMEYQQLLMQWRGACALEKLAAKSGQSGEGETGIKDHLTAMKQAEVNALRALGQDDGHGDVDPAGIWADRDFGTGDLDSGMFGGGGGTCDLSFTIGGEVVSMPPQFWRIVSIIHWLMIAGAYLWVASKLG